MPLKLTLLIGTFVAAFALGGLTNLYLLYKTSVLRTMLIFLSSLILIMVNLFAFSFFPELPSIETLGLIIYLIGAGLNIWILPRLVSDLIIQPIPSAFKVIHILWTVSYILLCSLAFLAPGIPLLQPIILIMQVGSIGAALTILILNLGPMKKRWWFQGVLSFVILSAGFLLLLTLDILITSLPIPALAALDNLSLPLYLILLSAGIYAFSQKYLSREALLVDSKPSPSCMSFYDLTKREAEIIAVVLEGLSNQEIAYRLHISNKTVENHLYSAYRKFDVSSRVQLVQLLQTWKKSEDG
jgi:DNA-binding CsgD family transcriptional regulator